MSAMSSLWWFRIIVQCVTMISLGNTQCPRVRIIVRKLAAHDRQSSVTISRIKHVCVRMRVYVCERAGADTQLMIRDVQTNTLCKQLHQF